MSKKHYVAIAAILRDTGSLDTIYRMADYFKADNPAFDRARFVAACGVEVAA